MALGLSCGVKTAAVPPGPTTKAFDRHHPPTPLDFYPGFDDEIIHPEHKLVLHAIRDGVLELHRESESDSPQ